MSAGNGKINMAALLRSAMSSYMRGVGTSVPGHILSFDPETQLAQVQIGIERVDDKGNRETPSPLIECPVLIQGGDAYLIEHQIDEGDECLIIFSQRCIDGWVDTGGVASQPILRLHSLDDAMVIVGLRSQAKAVSGHSNNGVKIRNKAGDKFIWLKNDGTAEITVDTITINAEMVHNGNNTQNGNLTQKGDTTSSGTLTAQTKVVTPIVEASESITAPTLSGTTSVTSPSVTAGGIPMQSHTHSQAPDSDGNTQQNTGGPQ